MICPFVLAVFISQRLDTTLQCLYLLEAPDEHLSFF